MWVKTQRSQLAFTEAATIKRPDKLPYWPMITISEKPDKYRVSPSCLKALFNKNQKMILMVESKPGIRSQFRSLLPIHKSKPFRGTKYISASRTIN
jgi:hypothetical protein